MASRADQETRKQSDRAPIGKGVDERILVAMANPLRAHILAILFERAASATELSKELGKPFDKVSYEMSALKKADLIELISERRVRGAVELFYKATEWVCIDQSEWLSVPETLKGGMRGSLLKTVMDDAVIAISEETYDSVENAHMSWVPMLVDGEGWDRITEILRRALEDVIQVREDSAGRLIASDEKGIPCTVSMLGYGAAADPKKVGPPLDTKAPTKSTASPKRKAAKKRRRKAPERQ
jgi:DNA-binding transcriptional ArsR family regulator